MTFGAAAGPLPFAVELAAAAGSDDAGAAALGMGSDRRRSRALGASALLTCDDSRRCDLPDLAACGPKPRAASDGALAGVGPGTQGIERFEQPVQVNCSALRSQRSRRRMQAWHRGA